MNEHVVASGETLSSIARDHGISVKEILAANPSITHPDRIKPGQKLAIPAKAPLRVRLTFNGRKLVVWHDETNEKLASYAAISGLPAKSPAIAKVAKKHGLELDTNTNYTDPKYQDKAWSGPIPEASYYLPLTTSMAFDKTGGGWGRGGWLLKESFWNRFGGRSGFFLHHDGGDPGTAGCIGVIDGATMTKLQTLFKQAAADGQSEVTIEVDYD